jgi:hypothetical protein
MLVAEFADVVVRSLVLLMLFSLLVVLSHKVMTRSCKYERYRTLDFPFSLFVCAYRVTYQRVENVIRRRTSLPTQVQDEYPRSLFYYLIFALLSGTKSKSECVHAYENVMTTRTSFSAEKNLP